MSRRAGCLGLAAFLLAGLGAPAFAQEDWRQFVITDVVGSIGSGASSQLVEKDDWTKYAPGNLFDGVEDSAWAEGVEGDGVGEQVWFTVDLGTSDLSLTNGCAKNNRVKLLAASLWIGVTREVPEDEERRWFHARLASREIFLPLADTATTQSVALPFDWDGLQADPQELLEEYRAEFGFDKDLFRCWTEYIICLEIREVYRSTGSRDTSISEISWTLPPEAAGPGGTRAFDLAGCWKAESGAAWDFLQLERIPGYPLTFYLYEEDGRSRGNGHWHVGYGKLTLEHYLGKKVWVYTDGELAGTLMLISEDRHRESYSRVEEDFCLWD